MAHWHNENPWKDHVVYVTLEELAECIAGGTITFFPSRQTAPLDVEYCLNRWHERGDKLDAYILPSPSGFHSVGVRYGPAGEDYFSPYARNQEKVIGLLQKYRVLNNK